MGLDGGSIPSRSDLLRRASWRLSQSKKGLARSTRGGQINENNFRSDEAALNQQQLAEIRLSTCSLSAETLRSPVMCCELGFLYNRSALLDFFAGTGVFATNKDEYAKQFSHLRSLKDVFLVDFVTNKAATSAGKDEKKRDSAEANAQPGSSTALVPFFAGSSSSSASIALSDVPASSTTVALFVCPVSGLESNGRHPICALMTCGHCFAQAALQELKETVCVTCGKPFAQDDVITLAASGDQMEKLVDRLIAKRTAAKLQRKLEKKAAADAKRKAEAASSMDVDSTGDEKASDSSSSSSANSAQDSSRSPNNGASALLPAASASSASAAAASASSSAGQSQSKKRKADAITNDASGSSSSSASAAAAAVKVARSASKSDVKANAASASKPASAAKPAVSKPASSSSSSSSANSRSSNGTGSGGGAGSSKPQFMVLLNPRPIEPVKPVEKKPRLTKAQREFLAASQKKEEEVGKRTWWAL